MFGWFQRLLPQRGDFFGMFEAHAATLVAAAEALQQLATNGCSTRDILATIRKHEHEADDVIREVLTDGPQDLSHAVRPRIDHLADRGDGRRDRRDARSRQGDRSLRAQRSRGRR